MLKYPQFPSQSTKLQKCPQFLPHSPFLVTHINTITNTTETTAEATTSMASIPFSIQLHFTSTSSNAYFEASGKKLSSPFFAANRVLGWLRPSRLRHKVGIRHAGGGGAKCWFKFGKNGVDAEGAGIYGSQRRDDFSHYDVEQYFDYTGMLAVEGSYDKVEALLNQNISPVDILLMMAASEGDRTKIEELMRAGARYDVRDAEGRTALDRAESDEIRDLILGFSVQTL